MIQLEDKDLLSQLLAPISVDDFFNEIYGKDYCHIQNRDNDIYKNILTLEDIDDALKLQKIPATAIKIKKEGKDLPIDSWYKSNGTFSGSVSINEKKIFEHLNQGCSLILNYLNRFIPKLQQFMELFKTEMSAISWANIYITPNTAKALEKHFDPHDVFVLQIKGTKHWRLYDTVVELPDDDLPMENYIPLCEKAKLVKEITLEEGDLLYFPRGMVHDAITSDEVSVHVTLGVIAPKMKDVISTLQSESIKELFFRKRIDAALKEFKGVDELEKKFKESLIEIIKKTSLRHLLEQTNLEFQKRTFNSTPSRGLTNFINRKKISEDTVIARRKDGKFQVSAEGKFICLYYNGRIERFPLPLQEIIKHIINNDFVKIKDLPGEIPISFKVKIVGQLLDKHLIDIRK